MNGADPASIALSLWPVMTPANRQSMDQELQADGYTPVGQVDYNNATTPQYTPPATNVITSPAPTGVPNGVQFAPSQLYPTSSAAPGTASVSVSVFSKYWWVLAVAGVGLAWLLWRQK